MRRQPSIKSIAIYFFAGVSLIFEFYFGILSWVWFVVNVILLALIITSLFRIFPKNRWVPFSETLRSSAFGILATLGFFFSLFFLFTGYYTVFPGKISDIIISNGKQKIVFLSMSHIATADFYIQKRERILTLASNPYVFLIEWVKSGTDESHARFNESLGMQFDKELYPMLASVAGLEVQSGWMLFSWILDERLKNIDMTMDEIASLIQTWSITPLIESWWLDLESQLGLIWDLSFQEQQFIRYIFRAFLNWSIVNMSDVEKLALAHENKLFDIILGKRNQKIIDYIIANPDQNVVVVYGALHFSGIFEALALHDKNWKISTYSSYTPYSE